MCIYLITFAKIKIMNKIKYVSLIILATCTMCSRIPNAPDYSQSSYWFSSNDNSKDVDIFYVYPTVITTPYNENNHSWLADISIDSIKTMANENQDFNKRLYSDYNFFAPYYRQIILDAYKQNAWKIRRSKHVAASDVENAFQYYMEHFNGGRPFILVGHSQGSEMLVELLKSGMTDSQFQQMVAAYCIGHQITEKELRQNPNRLIPAKDSSDVGCVVIFNSVTDLSGVSPLFAATAVGINPISWTTDTTFVSKEKHIGLAKYNDSRDSILIIPNVTGGSLQHNMMVCSDLPSDFTYNEEYKDMFPLGNLHFADSWLYGGDVKYNMSVRVKHFLQQ